MAYADYTFYTGIYGGDQLTKELFSKLSEKASAYIDRITYQRLIHGAKITDNVKMAVCAVSEVYAKRQEQESNRPIGVQSENVDGYSVSYANNEEYISFWNKRVQEAADLFLPLSDPLRYAGVNQ